MARHQMIGQSRADVFSDIDLTLPPGGTAGASLEDRPPQERLVQALPATVGAAL
jgi:hypothetical protein